MASLLEAYADYGREYSFDTVGLVPVPSEGHTGNRYIPIVHGKDFPSAVAHENLPGYERRGRNVAASVDRALEAASDEDRERFAIALKSEAAMLAEEWAFRHRYRYDPVAGSVPTGSGTELSDGDIADVVGALEAEFRRRNFPASAASAEQDCADERNLKATGFPCPVCGADCTAVPDRKGRRSDIGGVLRRPAILKCGSCGAERELRLMNDGYAVGYFVKDFPHPLAETRPLIELRNRAESETDTARRRGLLCELALELYRNDMLDEARERAREAAMTLPSEPGEGFDDHVRTLAVLMLCSNGSMGKLSKRVAAIRNTRSKDLTGRYGALFASLCAVTAKNPSETARFCEIASGLLDGMPMDFVALVARKNVVTAMSVKNAKDRHPGVLEAMDIAEDWAEHIGDGPSSADAKQLAMIFEAAVTIAAVNGMRAEARGFVNGFGDRHTMKGTGLHPIVTFRRALVDYTDGRTDDAIAGFTEVLDLYDTGEDRGGPAMARAAMAATILGHEVDSSLYARGMLMASALLRGGSVDREGMTEFLRVWCPLAAREMHWSERVMTLKHAGMEYLEGHMEDFAKERADANAVWNSSRFLICRGKRFIPL